MSEAGDRRAALAAWSREPSLNELDAMMWRTERHPDSSWTGVVVHELGGTPDFDRLRAAHERFLRLVPRFRQRVVSPLLPVGTPMWADDPHFDLDYHLRRVGLPSPGTREQLVALAQQLALDPLDRSRPPWIGVFVEGLQGGRSAYLLQVHHVLMDGAAFAQLHRLVLSPVDRAGTPRPIDDPEPVNRTALDVTRDDLVDQVRVAPRIAAGVLGTVEAAVRRPRSALAYAGSVGRVVRPVSAAGSPVLRPGSRRQWRFGTLECGLADLKAAGKAVGGTVNDTYVAALLGGLRRYCAAFGEDLGDVSISMPVAMRRSDEATGGNEFAGAFFAAPAGIADPAERIREMRRRVHEVRGEPALNLLASVTPAINRTPARLVSPLVQRMTRAVLTTSSWPGLAEPLHLSGVPFERLFVFAPLPQTMLTGAMNTHVGTCCIALNADGETFTDLDLLWRSMRESLDEVLALV